jgi:hypothetical protein
VVQEKVEAAVRARDLAVRKALEERNAADVPGKHWIWWLITGLLRRIMMLMILNWRFGCIEQ